MHRLSAQRWSRHSVCGEQGGHFCSCTTNPIAGPQRNKSVIPGSQLCSQLSSPPQGHCGSSAHTSFSPTLTFSFSPQTFRSAPHNTGTKLPTTCAKLCMDGTDSPFSLLTFKPCSRVGQQSRQLSHIGTGVSRNPSPAPCAVGTGVCSCPWTGGERRDSRRHRAHVSRARPAAGAISGEPLLVEQKRQNSEALTEKEKPWCFEREARFPSLPPGRTGDSLAKIREDCSALWQQGSRGAQRLLR